MQDQLQHIAIVPDGNRTRAKNNWLAEHEWHQAWYSRTKELLEHIFDSIDSIVWVTFWAMSTENLKKRSKIELQVLYWLMEKALIELEPVLKKHKLNFMWHGSLEWLSKSLIVKLDDLQDAFTQIGERTFNLLFNYGGKRHIQQAVQQCLAKWVSHIDEFMSFGDLPPVDLIIRTKGVHRTSGFLPRESYAERYFTDLMYPDFGTSQLDLAVQTRSQRKRNFWA